MNQDVAQLHSEVIDNVGKMFQEDIDSKTNEVMNNAGNLEILPINNYVLVKPYSVNPYTKIKVSDGGLAMTNTEHKIFNSDRGEEETPEMWERVGNVIEVSPSCKFVKEGDDIFYRHMQSVPVSFLGLGLEVVAENQILVVVNEGLKKRFGMVN